MKFAEKNKLILLVAIIMIAVFFRFWQFDSIPPGLYQDEAMNGNDAIASLQNGDFKVFYTNNNGREGMIVWLDALAVKMFGNTAWALRVFPALAGVLAVLGLYFLVNGLYGAWIALAASYFMATGFWAVNFSRMGFRANLMLPFLIWSMYFLLRGFNKWESGSHPHRFKEVRLRSKSDFEVPRSPTSEDFWLFLIAGVLFGLGFYTYIAYRFAAVLLLAYFLPYLIGHGSKKLWAGILIFSIIAFIVALPIGLYFLNNQGDFFGRSGQVAVWSSVNPFKAIALSVAGALGMFNVLGDFNWRHNFAGSPQLFIPVGLLFLLGILINAIRRNRADKFLLLWFFIFLLPNILSSEGNPHALRALGAMPAAMVFAGIGFVWICEKIKTYIDGRIKNPEFKRYKNQLLRIKKELFLLLIVFLFSVLAYEFDKYFLRWAANPNVAEAFSYGQVKIAEYLNNLPTETKKYVLWHPDDRITNNGLPVSAQTVLFLTRGKSEINYLRADEIDKIKLGKNGTVIIPIYFDLDLLHNLQKKYSESQIEIIEINVGVVAVP